MREFSLCKELSRKLSKDLGATPFSFGKASLTHSDLLSKMDLRVADEDGVVKNIPVWYGEARGDEGIVCCLLAVLAMEPKLGHPDNEPSGPLELELACVIGFKDFDGEFQSDGVRLSFHYDWTNEEDPGTMVMKAGDKWVPISLAQRLQLVLGFEAMVQDGILWRQSANIPQELRKDLTEVIEVDEKTS